MIVLVKAIANIKYENPKSLSIKATKEKYGVP